MTYKQELLQEYCGKSLAFSLSTVDDPLKVIITNMIRVYTVHFIVQPVQLTS